VVGISQGTWERPQGIGGQLTDCGKQVFGIRAHGDPLNDKKNKMPILPTTRKKAETACPIRRQAYPKARRRIGGIHHNAMYIALSPGC